VAPPTAKLVPPATDGCERDPEAIGEVFGGGRAVRETLRVRRRRRVVHAAHRVEIAAVEQAVAEDVKRRISRVAERAEREAEAQNEGAQHVVLLKTLPLRV